VLARLHALQTTQEQHDLGLEIVRDQLRVQLGDLTAETLGTTRLALEDYEVSLFDVADA
jgi:hypothetical protein